MEIQKDTNKFEILILKSLEKLDRTIVERKINLNIADKRDGIAFTDNKENIFINTALIRRTLNRVNSFDKKIEFIGVLKGLNLHEISHMLYTDYKTEDYDNIKTQLNLISYYDRQQLKDTINILEDGRIENNLILEYPISKKYFKFAFIKFFRENFKEKTDLKDLISIAQVNLRLLSTNYTTDTEILKMREICLKSFDNNFKCSNKIKDLVKLYISKELHKNKKQRLEIATEIYTELFKLQEDKDQQQKKKRDGTQTDKEKKEEEEEDQQQKETEENLNKLLSSIRLNLEKDLKKDTDLKKQLVEIEKQLNNTDGKLIDFNKLKPVVMQFKREILKLKNKSSKTRINREKKGYFNTKDFIKNFSSKDINKLQKSFYRRENLNKNNTEMTISILLDSSGSVRNPDYKTELETAYIISKALEETKNKTEIIEFSSVGRNSQYRGFISIKDFKKDTNSGNYQRHFSYGTDIITPLIYTYENLKKQKDKNNYIIVLTDGEIPSEDHTQLRQLCTNIKSSKIEIHLISIGKHRQEYISQSFNSVIEINNFEEIITQLKKLILNIQRNLIK